jgi:hypothetical protein
MLAKEKHSDGAMASSLPEGPKKFSSFWQLRGRNPTHDNNLEGCVKRNCGPPRPQGKFRLFPLPKRKKLPKIMRKSLLARARTRKNFWRSLNLFALGALRVECFALPLYLWSAFNGPGRANIRAGPAVRAKGGIDPGSVIPLRDSLERTDHQAVPAVGAFFGNLVSHKINSYP